MKWFCFLSIFVISNAIAGCSNFDSNDQIEVSPSFDNEFGEMFGVEEKIGIIGGQVTAGEDQKWMWHFWGEEVQYKEFSAVAINIETNEEIDPIKIDYEMLIPTEDGLISHSPSQVMFPSEGIWKVKAYVDDEFFEEFVVEVFP
ncbi:DUF4871 domain-containing protein [Shouchella clausii]|uniref:DUF4871 domain-containing protein n=1 Tax=Shouchella clausii TaxID=79880 RepID=UPI0039833EE7